MSRTSKFSRLEPYLHALIQFILLAMLVTVVVTRIYTKLAGDQLEFRSTFASFDRIFYPMMNEYHERIKDLAHFPPPADKAHLPEWIDSVRAHLAFPAGIFLWKDTTIQVAHSPEHLAEYLADLPRTVHPATRLKEQLNADTLGNMILWHGQTKVDTLRASVKAFQRISDDMAWGVVYKSDDARRQLAQELLAYDPHNLLVARPWAARVSSRPETPFRVLAGDSVIAQTPGLDTTLSKYAEKRPEFRFEYYVDGIDQIYIDLLKKPRTLSALLIVLPLVMLVLFLYHRRLRTAMRSAQPPNAGGKPEAAQPD